MTRQGGNGSRSGDPNPARHLRRYRESAGSAGERGDAARFCRLCARVRAAASVVSITGITSGYAPRRKRVLLPVQARRRGPWPPE